jgi:hypothetical protein
MASIAYDPTNEPTGFTRMRPKTRNLQRFKHLQNRNRTIALSECVATFADGSTATVSKRRKDKKVYLTPPNKTVSVRRRTLRADITTYIEIAERFGLNPRHVAELYRTRADNGYILEQRTVNVETNATFRGGDY